MSNCVKLFVPEFELWCESEGPEVGIKLPRAPVPAFKSAKGEQCLALFFAHREIAFGDGQQSFGIPAATMTPITVLRSASTIFPSELLGRRRNIGHEFARLI